MLNIYIKVYKKIRGVSRNLSRVGLIFFLFPGGGAQHPLGPENPLKLIDFTGPEYASEKINHKNCEMCFFTRLLFFE